MELFYNRERRTLAISLSILAASFIAALGLEYASRPELLNWTTSERAHFRVQHLYGWALITIAFGLPALWWHLIDHSERDLRGGQTNPLLSYWPIAVCLAVGSIGIMLLSSRLTEKYFCLGAGSFTDDQGNTWTTLCHPPLLYGYELLIGLPLVVLLMFVFAKTIAFFPVAKNLFR